MPKIADIGYPESNHVDNKTSFLYGNEMVSTTEDLCNNKDSITDIPSLITDRLKSSPALSASAFYCGNQAPIHEVGTTFMFNTTDDYSSFELLPELIQSEIKDHIYEEGATNYVVIYDKYNILCTEVNTQLDNYDANRYFKKIPVKTNQGEVDHYIHYIYKSGKFNCPKEDIPTLEFEDLAAEGITYRLDDEIIYLNQEKSPYYQALADAFETAKSYFEKYCKDAIEFKEAVVDSGDYKNENKNHPIDDRVRQIDNYNWSSPNQNNPLEDENREVPNEEDVPNQETVSANNIVNRYDEVDISDNDSLAKSLNLNSGGKLYYYGSLTDENGNEVKVYYDSGENNPTYFGDGIATIDATRLFTIVDGKKCYITNNPITQSFDNTAGSGITGANSGWHYDISIVTDGKGNPTDQYYDGMGEVRNDGKDLVFWNQETFLQEDGAYYYKDTNNNTIKLGNSWNTNTDKPKGSYAIGNYTSNEGGEHDE